MTFHTPTSPEIRPASSSDLDRIEALLTASGLPLDGVADCLEGFLVAEHEGEIVGVVGVEHCCREYGLLRSTAVAPEWRGHGIGRRLVARAIAESEANGSKALYLLTMTAEHYFPSFGFVTTTRDAVPEEVLGTAEFCGACPASSTVMTLAIEHD